MLTFGEREQWLTVKGRSRRYVEKVVEEVEGKGGRVVVKEVTRVEVREGFLKRLKKVFTEQHLTQK